MKNKERTVWIIGIIILLVATIIVSRSNKSIDRDFDNHVLSQGQLNVQAYLSDLTYNQDRVYNDLYTGRLHSKALDTEVKYMISQGINIKEIGYSEIIFSMIDDSDNRETLILFNIVGLKDDKIHSSAVLDLSDYFKELLNQDSKSVGTDYFASVTNATMLEGNYINNSNFIKHDSNINCFIYTLDPMRLTKEVYDNELVLRTVATKYENNIDGHYVSAAAFASNYSGFFGISTLYSDGLKYVFGDDQMNEWILTVETEFYLDE